jgi:hypothetical protein
VGEDPNGSVDEVFFGRERPGRDRSEEERDEPHGPDLPVGRRWLIAVGVVVAGLAAAVVVLAVARPGRAPAAGPGVVRVLTGNLVGFRLGRGADADLNVQYLQTPAGQPSVSISVAVTGLPRGVDYLVTAGECRGGTARVLVSSSGLPDAVSGLLLVTLPNMAGSERSVVWVRVANAFGAQLGGVRSPFIVPGSGTPIAPGKPACPLPGEPDLLIPGRGDEPCAANPDHRDHANSPRRATDSSRRARTRLPG